MGEALAHAIEVGEVCERQHVVERIEHFFSGGIVRAREEESASAPQDRFADLQSPTFGCGRGDALANLRDGEFAEPFAESELLLWCELTEERGGALLAFDEVDAPLGGGIDGLRRWRRWRGLIGRAKSLSCAQPSNVIVLMILRVLRVHTFYVVDGLWFNCKKVCARLGADLC